MILFCAAPPSSSHVNVRSFILRYFSRLDTHARDTNYEMFPCWISLPWTTGGNSATGFELWFVYSTTECPFRLTINQSKSVQHWFTSPFSSLSLLFSHAGYFKFISLPLVTTAKGWRSLLSHTEFRERRKVRNSVCVGGWVGKGVCVHSRVSVQFARAYVRVLVCVRHAEMYTHAPRLIQS